MKIFFIDFALRTLFDHKSNNISDTEFYSDLKIILHTIFTIGGSSGGILYDLDYFQSFENECIHTVPWNVSHTGGIQPIMCNLGICLNNPCFSALNVYLIYDFCDIVSGVRDQWSLNKLLEKNERLQPIKLSLMQLKKDYLTNKQLIIELFYNSYEKLNPAKQFDKFRTQKCKNLVNELFEYLLAIKIYFIFMCLCVYTLLFK